MTASNARLKLLKSLHTSIDDKTEADAKQRKLDPPNSSEGTDPSVINRDVDQAKKGSFASKNSTPGNAEQHQKGLHVRWYFARLQSYETGGTSDP